VTARQVHGARAAEVRRLDEDPGEVDVLATAEPGVLVGVLGADCPGVLIVDPARRALAVAHAGWRGVASGVVFSAVEFLVERYGSKPADLRAAIGPGISAARYEVGPEVVTSLREAGLDGPGVVRPGRDDRSHVDLAAAVRLALVAGGVPSDAVADAGRCTSDEPEAFFSHRRDGPGTGRHALVGGWRGRG
jgi:YfiH family protein